MFRRIGTLENITVLKDSELGFNKVASLSKDWKQLVRKSFTQSTMDIEGEFDTANFLYFKARAISGCEKHGCNGNGDAFPWEELKKSFNTFASKGFYLEHASDDPEKAKGIIVSASTNEKDEYVECIVAVSKNDSPDICDQIMNQKINAVSMGCLAGIAVCSVCHNEARSEEQLCDHMKPYMDSQHTRPNPNYIKGRETDDTKIMVHAHLGKRIVYELNKNLIFNELSGVNKPADRDASIYSQTIIASQREDKIMAGETLDKLSYADVKQLKKALADEQDEFMSVIAKMVKAEIGKMTDGKAEKATIVAANEEPKKDEEKKEFPPKKDEEKKEDEKKEKKDDMGNEVKEDLKKLVKEEEGEKKTEKKEEGKEQSVAEAVKDIKKEVEEIAQVVNDIKQEVVDGGAAGLPAEVPAAMPDVMSGAPEIAPISEPALPGPNDTMLDNQKKEGSMNLVYVPGETFDTSYFIASDAKDVRKVLKASDVLPAEFQAAVMTDETKAAVTVEQVVEKLKEQAGDSIDGFTKLTADLKGLQKKAYEFFAFKQENDTKVNKDKEPTFSYDPNEKGSEKGEKATRPAARVIQQFYNQLPGTTVAEPSIALNLKSQLDESLRSVEELNKTVTSQDSQIKDLTSKLEMVTKKAKAEDVSKIIANLEIGDEAEQKKIVDQLADFNEAQVAVVAEILKKTPITASKSVVSSEDNVPAYVAKNENGAETPLENLMNMWTEGTQNKNLSSEQ